MNKLTIDEQLIKAGKELRDIKERYHVRMSLTVELTPNFNVHFHGFIVKDRMNRHSILRQIHDAFRASKIIGFIKIETITNEEGWLKYCVKQKKESVNECNYWIEMDDFNMFNNILDRLVEEAEREALDKKEQKAKKVDKLLKGIV